MRRPANFVRENYASENGGERKDCAVRSFAIAACVSYSTAQEIFARHGRQLNKGTPDWVTESVLKEQFPEAQRMHCRVSVPKFAQLFNEGHYIVHVRSHALAIIDGVIHDWRPRPKTKVWCAWRLV